MARSSTRRFLPLFVCCALIAGCGRHDPRLLVVSTSDVVGKTSPCGCHTPKGGLARRATFLDSVRAVRKRVLVVDAGGFFPGSEDEREAAPYMLHAMARLGTQAAGVGSSELRFGYTFAREAAREAGVTLLCANLSRFDGGEPAFERWHLFDVGGRKVGVFGLLSETAELGPARDSLRLEGAEEAARRAVVALRKQGAGVIVLLSQLGKDVGDSVTRGVPGIDLLIAGGGVPALTDGARVGHAMAVYGGTQGWQVGVADIGGEDGSPARDVSARTIVLGPDVRTQPAMAASVKAFEDSLNAHLKLRDASYGPAGVPGGKADHYVGMANCLTCHKVEYAQWQASPHARAWKTLVDLHKESTPECVACHVTGFAKPGGFRTGEDWARFGNVQCEACHGMGTQHKVWSEDGQVVAAATCMGCHTATTSPTFRLADYWPHVLHHPPAGLKPLPETPAHRLMREGKAAHGN